MVGGQETFVVKGQRTTRIWQFVSLVLVILLLLMTSLLIWQVVKSGQQSSTNEQGAQSNPPQASSIFLSPCPRIPNLLPLPKSVPSGILEVLKQVEIQIGTYVDKELSIPAISANIFYQNNVIWSGHYGSKRTGDTTDKPDGNTRYRIASVSKIFPVLMAYKLYEEGLIGSLDDPLNKYAPDFDIRNIFTRDNITIREMASQMSGLPREAPCIYYCSNTTTREQLRLLHHRSLVKIPWTQPTYSNLAYALIGRVLSENILNQTYESWVIQNLLEPLGMRDTGFEITAAVEENMAYPYDKDGNLIKFLKVGWIAPATEMYSTLNDLTKLGMMFARPDSQALFMEATLREILLPQNIAPDGHTLWGAPWEMLFINGFAIRGKAGYIDSYNTFMTVIPELQLGMNVLVSSAPIARSNYVALLITERTYKALLPAFNNTMFELNRQAAFPIPAEPYLGEFNLKYIHPITNVVYYYNVSVTVRNEVLIIAYVTSVELAEIRYVGDPVLLQAKLIIPGVLSCLGERSGIYQEVYFESPKGGLSLGFKMPGLSVSAVRMSGGSRVSRLTDRTGVPDFSWLQQVY